MKKNRTFICGLPGNEVIHFRCNHKMECVFIKDIIYIDSDGPYSKICLEKKRKKVICMGLKNFQVQLNNYGFVRFSRFLLVNSHKVKYFCSKRRVGFIGDTELVVSVRNSKEVFRILLEAGKEDKTSGS